MPEDVRRRGLRVIDRVLGEDSENRELWGEGEPDEWLRAVEDLRAGLA